MKAFGARPENILLFIHEVFEGLISASYTGVQYDYQIPCMECVKTVCTLSYNIDNKYVQLLLLLLLNCVKCVRTQ